MEIDCKCAQLQGIGRLTYMKLYQAGWVSSQRSVPGILHRDLSFWGNSPTEMYD